MIDKKRRLEQELDRLRQHLLAVEEGYTQEALTTEERERDLRKKLQGGLQLITIYPDLFHKLMHFIPHG